MPRRATARKRRPLLRLAIAGWLCLSAALSIAAAPASASWPAAPSEIVVSYGPRAVAAGAQDLGTERLRVVPVPDGASMAAELRRLRSGRGVAWALPDYRARIADETPFPDDRGTGDEPGDWKDLQWNFSGPFGVNAPEAWAHLIADGAPGGTGVVVAVLDTGVAYANHGRFIRSPDFKPATFVKGYDFIARNPYPEDRNGHGTFVASTIAEATDNEFGLTGLAYGARIMPVRVLNARGEGDATTIAEGVYFAVRHGAQVINLSLEFTPGVTASSIPELIRALEFAHRHGVLVVAAAGNEGHEAIAYPARGPNVVSVGATTIDGCLAVYSNDGARLTIVAPGGGSDADLPGDPNCHPTNPGPDIDQITLTGSSPRKFGIPEGYEGTSMATPHVAAAAALVIASGILGAHPSPAALTARLRTTARKLGGGGDERLYGAGLLDAGAATAPLTAIPETSTGSG